MSDQQQEQQFPPPSQEPTQMPPQYEPPQPQEPQKKPVYKQVWLWVVIAVVLVVGVIGAVMPRGETPGSGNVSQGSGNSEDSTQWVKVERGEATYSVMDDWRDSNDEDSRYYYFSSDSPFNFAMVQELESGLPNSKETLMEIYSAFRLSVKNAQVTKSGFASSYGIDGYEYDMTGFFSESERTMEMLGFFFVGNDGIAYHISAMLDPSDASYELYRDYAEQFLKSILPSNGAGIPYAESSEADIEQDDPKPEPSSEPEPEPTPDSEKPSVSISQKNALKKAKSYLSHQAFSYTGLIEQLEYEGYSNEDATYGADNCEADWYEQAEKKAASYLSHQAFSRNGLIEQLEYEGFTPEQATHGADSVGL
jgi:hypothetical protein